MGTATSKAPPLGATDWGAVEEEEEEEEGEEEEEESIEDDEATEDRFAMEDIRPLLLLPAAAAASCCLLLLCCSRCCFYAFHYGRKTEGGGREEGGRRGGRGVVRLRGVCRRNQELRGGESWQCQETPPQKRKIEKTKRQAIDPRFLPKGEGGSMIDDRGFRGWPEAQRQGRTKDHFRTRSLSGPHGPARELRRAYEVGCVVLISFHNQG